MWHVEIDLHRRTVVIAAVDDLGTASAAARFACRETVRHRTSQPTVRAYYAYAFVK